MTVEAQKETLGFQTEVKQVLDLVVNALYSNRDIFLRELISNAADASDKLRFLALNDNALYQGDNRSDITVEVDKAKSRVVITDHGIGMTREEVINNLGTIAKSGTKDFLRNLSADQLKEANLIGQFGVGFYSAYIVADKVVVETRRAGTDAQQGVKWVSDGTGEYTIENIERAERGTRITLFLKADADDYLEEYKLRNIIRTYSDHIPFEIRMPKLNDTAPSTDNKWEQKAESQTKSTEFETINRAQAIWTLAKSDVSKDDYIEFYKHISHDFEEPLTWAHNKVEGKLEYTSLLYVPGHAPFDMFNRETPKGLKLYVQRVFIMDEAEQFLPLYLRFIKGVVDTNDLPLNISRELLQSNKVIESVKAAITKRILSMLEKLASDDVVKYEKFWDAFGTVLKEGTVEDFANRDQIAKLLRFASTHRDSEKQEVSLDKYMSRMKSGQEKIYYLAADNFGAAVASPHLEVFRKKEIEVLLLTDRVDEWLVSHLTEYEGKKFESVSKGDLDLGELEDKADEETQKQQEDAFASLLEQVKKTLGDRVKDVKLTYRLTSSPACVVSDEADITPHMERILRAAGQTVAAGKPIFEINPEHALIHRMRDEADDEKFKKWVFVLFDQAVLSEGGNLDQPAKFVTRLNELLLDLSS